MGQLLMGQLPPHGLLMAHLIYNANLILMLLIREAYAYRKSVVLSNNNKN